MDQSISLRPIYEPEAVTWSITSAYSLTLPARQEFSQAIDGAKEFYEAFAPWIWAIFKFQGEPVEKQCSNAVRTAVKRNGHTARRNDSKQTRS